MTERLGIPSVLMARGPTQHQTSQAIVDGIFRKTVGTRVAPDNGFLTFLYGGGKSHNEYRYSKFHNTQFIYCRN